MAENVTGQNKNSQQNTDSSNTSHEDMTAANSDHQNSAPNRGGTTDMGSEQLQNATGTSRNNTGGSGITTKKSVTGSDYDGQVSQ